LIGDEKAALTFFSVRKKIPLKVKEKYNKVAVRLTEPRLTTEENPIIDKSSKSKK
jgi:hypothetical protein